MIVPCPYCGNESEQRLQICPTCGAKLPQPQSATPKPVKGFGNRVAYLSLVFILALCIGILYFLNRPEETRKMSVAEQTIDTESSYEELMSVTPFDAFGSGVYGLLLEKIFDKPLKSLTWDEVGRIKYIAASGRTTIYYSFYNSWEFEEAEEFERTIRKVHAASTSQSYDAGELGYFVGVQELDAYGAGQFVYGFELASLPELKHLVFCVAKDYEELKDLTSLESLTIRSSNGGKLTHLSSLVNLTELTLDYTDYQSLKDLQDLPKLTRLTLGKNSVPWDISSVSKLTNLTSLTLNGMEVKTLAPLAKLTNLKELSIENAAIKDLTFLRQMPALEVLRLHTLPYLTQIDTIPCPRLTTLSVDVENLRDSDFVNGLTSLTDLTVENGDEFSFLSSLPELKTLSLIHPNLNHGLPLEALINLTAFSISDLSKENGNEQSLVGLRSLSKLQHLEISNCMPTVDLEGVFLLPNLQSIEIRDTYMNFAPEDFMGFQYLKSLTLSSIIGLPVALELLPEMPQLAYLDMSEAELTDVHFLRKCPALQVLNLSENAITDITPVENLPQLELLNISGNPIDDRSVIGRLSSRFNVIE